MTSPEDRTVEPYRHLFEMMPDAVVVFRMGRLFDMNRKAEELFRMSKKELQNSSASALGLPETSQDFEATRLKLKDGRELVVELAGVSFRLDGEDVRLIAIRDLAGQERAAAVIQRKNRELEALNAVAELGIRSVPVQEVLEEAVRKMQMLTGTDSAALCLAGEDGKSLTLSAATGISDDVRRNAGQISFGLLWKVYQSGQALVENDLAARSDARRDLMEKSVTVYATVAAPIVSRGRVVGTLSACSYRPRVFSPEDAALLGTLGAQLGAVIENARLIEAQREQKEVSEILLAAATAFGRARTVDDLGDALLEAVAIASGRPANSLLLYDEDRDTLTLVAISGVDDAARSILVGRTWGPNNPPARWLRTERRTLVLSAEEGRKLDPDAWDSTSPGAIVFLPLFQQEHLLGAIAVNYDSTAQATPRAIATLEGLAGLCAASLSNLNLWGISERRASLGSMLLAAGQDLAVSREPDRVVRSTAALARKLAGTTAAWVWILSPSGMKAEGHDGGLESLAGREVGPGELFGGALFDGALPVAVSDFEASAEGRGTGALLGARSALGVTMRAGGRVLGAIVVGDQSVRRFAREDVTALETLATYAAVCLENARLVQDLSLSNEEIRGAQQQVVRAESLAAIGRLSAAIAHEVRNPLSGISAAAQALLKTAASADPASPDLQLLRIIDRESKRLNRIITDFLQFARPRNPAMRRVSVPLMIDSTIGLLEQDMGGKYRIERTFAPATPAAQADGDQLKQVLINLVLNSIQAMPGGGTLTFGTRAAELPSGPAVEITLEDSGPGIPPGDLARVFEPFFSTKKEGTGLGLAIAHQIVQSHGGSISVHSVPGQGALFRLLLPAATADAAPPRG